MFHKFLRLITSLILALGLGMTGISTAYAAAFTVNSTADNIDANPGDGVCDTGNGDCTLRAAIQEANVLTGDDTISLPNGTYILSIAGTEEDAAATGDLDISGNLTINGADAATTVIDGNALDRVIHILGPNDTVTITNLTIQNGSSPGNGGGISTAGMLTLSDSILRNNFSNCTGSAIFNEGTFISNRNVISENIGGGIYCLGMAVMNDSLGSMTLNSTSVMNNVPDGGIYNYGMLTLNSSTVSGNTGGGFNDTPGGIYNWSGSAILNNSTVSNNTTSSGGGVFTGGGGTLRLNNSTVTQNSADTGGGIYNYGSAGDVILRNTIVAGNVASGNGPDCSGSISSEGYNLIGNASNCDFTAGTGDYINVDAQLGSLIGSPAHHPLLPVSPAIDAGNPAGCTDQDGILLATDQRGITRPQGIGCDIGAYEYVFTTPGPATSIAVLTGSGQIAFSTQAFSKPLRVVALDDQGNRVSGVTVTFTAPASGASGTFTGTGTNSTSVNTDGGGVATTSTFTANSQVGAYTVSASAAGLGSVSFNLEQIAAAANDQFAGAKVISSLPFDETVDTATASTEAGEPTPSCAPNGPFNTVWYVFTPDVTRSISANNTASTFNPVLAVYTGDSLVSLTEVGCQMNGTSVSFLADGGTTYYFQAGGEKDSGYAGEMLFHVDVTPPPVADFYFYPSNPSAFDTIAFSDISSDPGQAGYQSFSWDFGDGTSITGPESFANHQYAQDGNYTVQHSVTTVDGRTDSTSQVVQVRTHDIAIAKITAPKSANSGQTKAITVAIRNTRYPETITVDLYKSTPGGDVWIDSLTLPVPILSGNKTKLFSFNYTFTVQDAQIGKVTFKAFASIAGANDVFPSDNTGISSPPTKVSR